MLSLGSHLNHSLLHSLVDSFFDSKKAAVKERLMDSVRVIVDGLFEEMVGQVKEMLLPPLKNYDDQQLKFSTPLPVTPPTFNCAPNSSSATKFEKSKPSMIFATKSKPGSSTSTQQQQQQQQPFSGLYKRMAEEDGSSSSTQLKKKAITVELEMDDGDLVLSNFDDSFAGGEIAGANDNAVFELKTTYNADQFDLLQPQAGPSTQVPSSRKKYLCPEPGCGKHFLSGDLKRHIRIHQKVKPYFCNFPGCTYESENRPNVIRHIKSVHLKNKKMSEVDGENENEEDQPPDDPAVYLSVKQELL